MKVDYIVKNATIFTADKTNLDAECFAVKDGKIVYVGSEEGLVNYEGPEKDLKGKFVMPAFMDSHVHIPLSIVFDNLGPLEFVYGNNKTECLQCIKNYVDQHPELNRYVMLMELAYLDGEKLIKEDLDKICNDKELIILECEGHSEWVNSYTLENNNITDETEDISEISYFERDENGHKTGNLFEGAGTMILCSQAKELSDKQIEEGVKKWIEFCEDRGIVAVFEAGTPGVPEFHEHTYDVLKQMDLRGELPIYIDGSYSVIDPRTVFDAIEEVKRYREKYDSPHLKVNTLKIMLDGTMNIRTAYMVEPYKDTNTVGGRSVDTDTLTEVIKILNENNLNLHVHTVAEGAIKSVLDATERARKEIGEDFNVEVTCAHLEIMRDEDIGRFAELGVYANFTPWWHNGSGITGRYPNAVRFLGQERADKMYRSKSMYDTKALVCWSCDTIHFADFKDWNPMLGVEVGITRNINKNTDSIPEYYNEGTYPKAEECMSYEEMLTGYTINNAKQICMNNAKGSITEGKDADFIVFDNDFRQGPAEGVSFLRPTEVYFSGKKIK